MKEHKLNIKESPVLHVRKLLISPGKESNKGLQFKRLMNFVNIDIPQFYQYQTSVSERKSALKDQINVFQRRLKSQSQSRYSSSQRVSTSPSSSRKDLLVDDMTSDYYKFGNKHTQTLKSNNYTSFSSAKNLHVTSPRPALEFQNKTLKELLNFHPSIEPQITRNTRNDRMFSKNRPKTQQDSSLAQKQIDKNDKLDLFFSTIDKPIFKYSQDEEAFNSARACKQHRPIILRQKKLQKQLDQIVKSPRQHKLFAFPKQQEPNYFFTEVDVSNIGRDIREDDTKITGSQCKTLVRKSIKHLKKDDYLKSRIQDPDVIKENRNYGQITERDIIEIEFLRIRNKILKQLQGIKDTENREDLLERLLSEWSEKIYNANSDLKAVEVANQVYEYIYGLRYL